MTSSDVKTTLKRRYHLRHVFVSVIMDKKPVLPDDEICVTKTVSEKYPGSPDRLLYGANATPSPSELEWEHALGGTDFDDCYTIKQTDE